MIVYDKKRSWTTKEMSENECLIGYKKTIGSKVCTVTFPELFIYVLLQLLVNKNKNKSDISKFIFSECVPCIIFAFFLGRQRRIFFIVTCMFRHV